ncbi:PepSY-like domain-containing protein [Flavobacterium suncheonense]|uniref:Putative beta-lactamase-inhibitor-like PepSY-like domain-containing protein n=1 Tax=Flavobacterium suncheonense GH29-5 = DSM 17707 TaxID=1121899 RepID=A0A0A2MDG0_9FLAO|nr:PepSY-like domain-containing protein [Flavobacterium suncheonense]KGO89503.1 hypothetical protein Q764_06940 [Flavobacterium suncheonense GH29-5 = DSM 17707]
MKTVFSLMVFLLLPLLSCDAQGRKIDPSQLPEGAHTFLKEHFPNKTIVRATKDWEHGEKGFEVWLNDGTEVEFWKDGSYREVDGHGKPIPTAYILPSITEYVKAKYPNEKITHIDWGHKDLDVDLTNKIDLEFDKNGNILKD